MDVRARRDPGAIRITQVGLLMASVGALLVVFGVVWVQWRRRMRERELPPEEEARLARLVQEDVLVRERYQERPPREHYRATGKGKELYPVLLALMNWGDRWYSGAAGPPARIHHLACGHDTTAVPACARCGEPLTADNTTQLPGPGGRTGPGTRILGPLIAARRPQ